MPDEATADEYDDDGFDEAFADLIKGLNEAEHCVSSTTGRADQQDAASQIVVEHDFKLPREAVYVLTERIEQTTMSPFSRFRKEKGRLSVVLRHLCADALGNRSC